MCASFVFLSQGYKESKKYIAAQGNMFLVITHACACAWHCICAHPNWCCLCARPQGGDCEWLLEDDLGAADLHHRHGFTLWRGKQGESKRVWMDGWMDGWMDALSWPMFEPGQVCSVLAVTRSRHWDLWGVYSKADLGRPLPRLHHPPSESNECEWLTASITYVVIYEEGQCNIYMCVHICA